MKTIVYDFSDLDVRSERMQLVKDRDFDEYFALVDKLTEQRTKAASEILELMYKHGCVMVQPTEGICKSHRYYIHRQTKGLGFRVTAWDNNGPICHTVIFDGSKGLEQELPPRKFTASYKEN